MSDSRKSSARGVRVVCLQCCGTGFHEGHLCDPCDGFGFEFIVEVEMIRPKARAHARAKQASRQVKAA